jgi:hypothetical protein
MWSTFRKLVVPSLLLVLFASAFVQNSGCGSSSGNGTGGATGDGSPPGDGATGGTDGGSSVAALCPTSPMRTATSPAMTASEFCKLFFATCVSPFVDGGTDAGPTDAATADGGFSSESSCETSYTNLMYETTRECRSYHVCNAAAYNTANVALHCGHAIGIGLCEDVAVSTDGSTTDAPAGQ